LPEPPGGAGDVGCEAEGCDADGAEADEPVVASAAVDGVASDAVPLDAVPGDEFEAAVVEGAEDRCLAEEQPPSTAVARIATVVARFMTPFGVCGKAFKTVAPACWHEYPTVLAWTPRRRHGFRRSASEISAATDSGTR
jgi:hypothetical protein